LRLPAFEDLSKEQDLIYNLDLDGNYLVTGPPGTGKSVMALYRAQVLSFDDREPAVLMFSNVLTQYTRQAAEEVDIAGFVTTFHKWMWGFWKAAYGSGPPMIDNSYSHDWDVISHKFLTDPPSSGALQDLLVDEGQDLPLGFFRMCRFLAKNMTVFADENQQLMDHQTTIKEIARAVGTKEPLELKRNYRNTAEIAKVAAKFYSGTPTGIPDLPTRHGEMPTLRHYERDAEFADFVSRYVSARTNLSIGIACDTWRQQKRLLNQLEFRNLPVPVQTYSSYDKAHRVLDFDGPGITIVNYQSLKGLEFDTLFVPELQQLTRDATSAATRMLFYVITSRARDELHLSYTGAGEVPAILKDLKGLVREL
jgi:DNA helicase IV